VYFILLIKTKTVVMTVLVCQLKLELK